MTLSAWLDARRPAPPVRLRARIDAALVDLVLEKIDGPEAPGDAGLPRDEGSAHP
jgi:hypothetical protein